MQKLFGLLLSISIHTMLVTWLLLIPALDFFKPATSPIKFTSINAVTVDAALVKAQFEQYQSSSVIPENLIQIPPIQPQAITETAQSEKENTQSQNQTPQTTPELVFKQTPSQTQNTDAKKHPQKKTLAEAEQAKQQRLAEERREAAAIKQKALEEARRKARAEAKQRAAAVQQQAAAQQQLKAQFESTVLKGRVEQVWRLPLGVPQGLSCTIKITFTPNGEVETIKLLRKSGNVLFDNAAIRAVYQATPLPIPTDLANEDFTFNFKPGN